MTIAAPSGYLTAVSFAPAGLAARTGILRSQDCAGGAKNPVPSALATASPASPCILPRVHGCVPNALNTSAIRRAGTFNRLQLPSIYPQASPKVPSIYLQPTPNLPSTCSEPTPNVRQYDANTAVMQRTCCSTTPFGRPQRAVRRQGSCDRKTKLPLREARSQPQRNLRP